MDHIVVETPRANHRWRDFHDCDEMTRSRQKWPYRQVPWTKPEKAPV